MPAYKHNSPKKKKKSNWVSRLKESVGLLSKGPKHSPAGKKYLAKQRQRGTGTMATKNIVARLRKAGLTEKEIAKLR